MTSVSRLYKCLSPIISSNMQSSSDISLDLKFNLLKTNLILFDLHIPPKREFYSHLPNSAYSVGVFFNAFSPLLLYSTYQQLHNVSLVLMVVFTLIIKIWKQFKYSKTGKQLNNGISTQWHIRQL